MKKIFLAALAATVLFASCAKEGSQGNTPIEPGDQAKVSIKLVNPVTRAIDTNPESYKDDIAVGEYAAFFLDDNGAVVTSVKVTTDVADPQEIETTTAAKKLLVISNFNTQLGNITTISNMTQLETAIASAVNLSTGETQTDGATLTKATNKVWSTGEAAIDWTGALNQTTGVYEKAVAITIRPVAAKVNLKVVVPSGYPASEAAAETSGNFFMNSDGGVMVLNAVSTTKFFGAKAFTNYTEAAYPWLTPATKAYYSGMDMGASTEFVYYNAGSTIRNFLHDVCTLTAAGDATYHYYLFENDADKPADFPTIVTLKGSWGMSETALNAAMDAKEAAASPLEYTTDEKAAIKAAYGRRDVYFRLQLTSLDAGAHFTTGSESTYGKGVQRGKCYNITLTLKNGIFNFPDPIEIPGPGEPPVVPPVVPPGGEDPTGDEADALCTVTVTVEEWVPMAINKEW